MMPELNPVSVTDLDYQNFLSGKQTLATTCGLSPDDLLLIAATGAEMLAKGQTNLAWEVYEGLTALAPDWYGGYAGMGAIALQRGKLEYAVAFLQKAVSLHDGDPAVFVNLGETLLRLNRAAEARQTLAQALALQPDESLASKTRALYEAIK